MPGLFDKDKEYGIRLDQEFDLKELFVLFDAKVTPGDTIETTIGDAQVARLKVAHLDENGHAEETVEVNTVASAIVAKIEESDAAEMAEELPAVCKLMRVKSRFGNDALVMRFVRDYENDGANDWDDARR